MARVIGTQIERETPSGDIVVEYFPEPGAVIFPPATPIAPSSGDAEEIQSIAFNTRIEVGFYANGKLHATKIANINLKL